MKTTRVLCGIALVALASCAKYPLPSNEVMRTYVQQFNEADSETYVNTYNNSQAAEFLTDKIPLLDCPDKELERTYYFRWWTYRKHVKQTPDGYVITEFLPPVGWAQKYNGIPCAGQHHTYEGRWLRDSTYVENNLRFWLTYPGINPRAYSFPAADATYAFWLVHRDMKLLTDLYPLLCQNFENWGDHYDADKNLYWQGDGYDGMECSVSGRMDPNTQGYRVTINSYMYADATALSRIAKLLGKADEASAWQKRAEGIKNRMDEALWDNDACFYKVWPRSKETLSDAREQHGYVPWVYDIPDESKGPAWAQMFDTLGFAAPYGPTTVERRHPGFSLTREGHDCKWDGPSWPYSTSQTLMGMARCIQRFGEKFITKEQYYNQLCIFSNSHRLGDRCFIDENLDPLTGEWLARSILMSHGNVIPDRGKDYNHSTFTDLVISGLLGVTPMPDGTLQVNPLLPEGKWDWWCLKGVPCAGKVYTIFYDRTGRHYGKGKGLVIKEGI